MTMNPNRLTSYASEIVGHNQLLNTPFGEVPMVYADWAASGRLFGPIEDKMLNTFGPWTANTHTESNSSGATMTEAYEYAKRLIKQHVGASDQDALLFTGSGMTSAVTTWQRLLGWRWPERLQQEANALSEVERPLVFVSSLEHHSNHTSWHETIADVEVVPPGEGTSFSMDWLGRALAANSHRKNKIAAVTAGSNVTGVRLPIYDIATVMHEAGGYCFVDYTCAAPYDAIDMNQSPESRLDAIYFSPHKFLGGPGAPGVLLFNKELHSNTIPDRPGGGTVLWTNPWGGRRYYDSIEAREDGGTPPFLGAIKAALAIKLKEQMGLEAIATREQELSDMMFSALGHTAGISILAPEQKDRLSVFALSLEGTHYNLATRILNDRFGIQVRGGCACAGTYGHELFNINQEQSRKITDRIDAGDLSMKPGFVRVSLHPTMSDETVHLIGEAIKTVVKDSASLARDYVLNPKTNEYQHKHGQPSALDIAKSFTL